MTKLTKKEIIAIIEEKRINEVSKENRRQVIVFAFGEEEFTNEEERLAAVTLLAGSSKVIDVWVNAQKNSIPTDE